MNRSCVAVAAALCVIAIAGCGGGDDGAGAPATAAPAATSAPVAEPAAATTTTSAAAPAETSTAAAPASGSGDTTPTPMGSKLKLGEPAVIAYDDASDHRQSTIEITPGAVERGSLDDFKNIQLDADQKTATPFYVKVKVRNVGDGDLSDTSPATYLNAIDDRGQNQNEVIFLGTFERCASERAESLKPDASYTTCLTYLIPKGGSVVGMRWIAFDEKTGKSNLEWR